MISDQRPMRAGRGTTVVALLAALLVTGSLVTPMSGDMGPWTETEHLQHADVELPYRDLPFAGIYDVDDETLVATHGINLVYVFARDEGSWNPVQKITPPAEKFPERGDHYWGGKPGPGCFGVSLSVDVDAGRMVIGDPCLDVPGNATTHEQDAGAVYIYERAENGTWEHVARFLGPTDGDWNDLEEGGAPDNYNTGPWMGFDVDVEGDTVVAGAPEAVVDGVSLAGVVDFYERADNGTWIRIHRSTTPTGEPELWDYFGASVSIAGERVAIGSPSEDAGAGSNAGAVHLYERGPDGWVPTARVAPPLLHAQGTSWSPPKSVGGEVETGESFGDDIDLDEDGTTLAVSAFWSGRTAGVGIPMGPDFDLPGVDSTLSHPIGAAYVFDLEDDEWTLTGVLENPERERRSWFGDVAVSEDGDTVVVGATRANKTNDVGYNIGRGFLDAIRVPPTPSTGAAFVFERAGGDWACTAKLSGHDTSMEDAFGHVPVAEGGDIYVNAPWTKGDPPGSLYKFVRSDAPVNGDFLASMDTCGPTI